MKCGRNIDTALQLKHLSRCGIPKLLLLSDIIWFDLQNLRCYCKSLDQDLQRLPVMAGEFKRCRTGEWFGLAADDREITLKRKEKRQKPACLSDDIIIMGLEEGADGQLCCKNYSDLVQNPGISQE